MGSHEPVLCDEVLELLAIRADGWYVDATFGRGGHARAVLARLGEQGRLIALDRDPDAVRAGHELMASDARLSVHEARFGRMTEQLAALGVAGKLSGVLFDLGVSSPQLDDAERGFSFLRDGPLDMRMDKAQPLTAADWLAGADEKEITRVLKNLGEEPNARRIARAIVRQRAGAPITRTAELAALVERATPARERVAGRHPATRTFQAVRMHINDELGELRAGLDAALDAVAVGGRIVAISFHSLEDRIVKRFMRDHARVDPALADLPIVPPGAEPRLRQLGRAARPGETEIARNPRARSATLRAAERVR